MIFNFSIQFLNSHYTLLLPFVYSITIPIKLYVLWFLIREAYPIQKRALPLLFLLGIIFGAITEETTWLLKMVRLFLLDKVGIELISEQTFTIFKRFSWFFFIVQMQSISLLITSLFHREYKISTTNKLLFFCGMPFGTYFLLSMFIDFHTVQYMTAIKLASVYASALMVTTLIVTFFKLFFSSKTLPKILKKQLTIITGLLLTPHMFFILAQLYPMARSPFQNASHVLDSYLLVLLQNIFLTATIWFCTKKIILLRFINLKKHVESPRQLNLINDFKVVLDQLSKVTELNELSHITKTFFKEALNIKTNKTQLFIRQLNNDSQEMPKLNKVEMFIEQDNDENKIQDYLAKHRILIRDEIEFNDFYRSNNTSQNMLQFLDDIDADVFLPIFLKEKIIAYILIEPEARQKNLYSNMERDELVVFCSYLSNIIYLLQNRNLDVMIEKEKSMREELYLKHQENNQYKESIRLFLKDRLQRKIGILFYKNNKFTFGNQDAKELIKINLNQQKGHGLSKAFVQVATRVEEYKSPQILMTSDSDGHSLVLNGIPNLESNNTIIAVYYPQISDIIKTQIDTLKDPSNWDYLLYLETTKSGKLINKLFPGTGEVILNFKISLLKLALTKKAILLNMPESDLVPTVEIFHHISLRQHLHILEIQSTTKNIDTSVKLFGMNTHLMGKVSLDRPLLQKLDDGTLFIKNIHLLDMENQNKLAHFIKYNIYTALHSVKNYTSNTRVICSTNQDLATLVRDNRFSQLLYDELQQATATLPSLLSLPEEELIQLTDKLTDQTIKTKEFHSILELTDKEKQKLINSKPVSITELQQKIKNILTLKSKENKISYETITEQQYETSDPQLIHAAQLGKHALRDQQIMSLLWNKFKNQNKIATFLGVNRSSVSRRCKIYKLN